MGNGLRPDIWKVEEKKRIIKNNKRIIKEEKEKKKKKEKRKNKKNKNKKQEKIKIKIIKKKKKKRKEKKEKKTCVISEFSKSSMILSASTQFVLTSISSSL